MSYRCNCACRDLCGHEHCPIRPFQRLSELLRNPKRYCAAWWASVREARDGVLIVLRAGPGDETPADAQFWAEYLLGVERLSAKLDRGYLRFIESRDYAGLRGTA